MHRESLLNCFILLWSCAGFVYTSGATTLIADPLRHAPCSGTLSLSCSLSTPEPPSHIYMSWVKETQHLCEATNGVVQHWGSEAQCHFDSKRLTLTVTLLQAGPQSQGVYTCKMRSELGLNHTTTAVLPPATCPGSFHHTSLESPAREQCLFYDMYPEAQVYWFSDSTNLTAFSTDNSSVRGASGLYNISSVLPTEGLPGDLSCRLSSHNSSHLITTMSGPGPRASPENIISFGSCPGLQWALLYAGLVLSLCE